MSEVSPPRAKVIICDDSATIRTVIRTILAPSYECLLIERGEDVLPTAGTFGPDIIISDVIMAGFDGYAVCKAVRADPRFQFVPIILLTSATDEESKTLGLEVGADDYLFKPVRPRELLARVASLMRLRSSNLQLERRSEELERLNRELASRTEQVEQSNVTLQKMQSALVQAEKLATIGTLVAGVAHEINNPLAFIRSGSVAIQGYVEDLEEILKQPDITAERRAQSEDPILELKSIAADISDGTSRLERIAADLRIAATAQTEHSEDVSVAVEVTRAWKMAAIRVTQKPEMICGLSASLPTVRVVPHLLGQVLLNVFGNAIQAMHGNGTVHVEGAIEGNELVLSIRDSGPGIPPELLGRVFDPFFTTKPPGEGTGLGLSVSYGIMQSLGGRIEAKSPPGQGATFTLHLPRAPEFDEYNLRRASKTSPAVALAP